MSYILKFETTQVNIHPVKDPSGNKSHIDMDVFFNQYNIETMGI